MARLALQSRDHLKTEKPPMRPVLGPPIKQSKRAVDAHSTRLASKEKTGIAPTLPDMAGAPNR
jgi:hypothetical protein